MSLKSLVLACVLSVGATAAAASTIVVAHDEWTLSDSGFASAPTTTQFVTNLVNEFGTAIHAYSSNFGLTGGALASAMAAAGATFTSGTGFDFTLANISTFDALMLGGTYLNATQLTDLETYVSNGGSVYIMGGTGAGGAVQEATEWNGFLSAFGVQMLPSYNGIGGTTAVSGDAIFNGVTGLFQNNGNSLTGSSVVCCGDAGLYAVWRSGTGGGGEEPAPIPLPAGLPLLLGGLAALGLARRRGTRI
jgi:hypothetical protein